MVHSVAAVHLFAAEASQLEPDPRPEAVTRCATKHTKPC